jgi:hypothetical protein
MNVLNEIRIKLTDFGRQFLRKDANLDIVALINTTAKEILTLLDESSDPQHWKPRHGEKYLTIQGDGTIKVQTFLGTETDHAYLDFHNCFPLTARKQAEHARDLIQDILRQAQQGK